jgi:hypothetical protein
MCGCGVYVGNICNRTESIHAEKYKYASESIYERDLCDSKYVILCECENTTIPIGLSE